MKKLYSVLAIIAAMSVLLLGCGSGTTGSKENAAGPASNEGTSSETTPEKSAEKPDENIALRYATWNYSDTKDATDAFIKNVKEKLGITIQLENYPTDQYESAIKAKIASGDAPDLIMAHSATASYGAQLVKQGEFADISGLSVLDQYIDSAKDANKVDGKLYAVTISTNVLGVMYNKKIFNDLGISVPTNIDEFTKAVEKIKAANIVPIAGGFKDSWTAQIIPFIAIAQSLQTPDHEVVKELSEGKVKYEQPAMIQAFGLQVDWTKKGYFQDNFLGTDINVASAMVGTGKAAMLINGTWQLKSVQDSNPQAEIGFFPLPLNKEGEPITIPTTLSGGLFVNAKGKNIESAKKVLEYYLGTENQTAFIENMKGITTNKTVKVEDPFLTEVNQALSSAGYVTNHFHGKYQSAAMATLLEKGWQNMLAGGTTAEKLAQDADKQVQKELAKAK
ncbi:extracellular solute-binding protein [Paenibacillus sp. sptzw28]|uniref:ABC transporter substrate-binding protein n=1 Tax=Paenibacillus sp. sptzw28 TaxID=715179 RepID=UPI001C6EB5C1|nr:extracellular solute-binding protein [Paenibacillus sp. sptzw28]QYR20591.1 extracellular solute-binding protein [Paenibacillus sp. sptzw28]